MLTPSRPLCTLTARACPPLPPSSHLPETQPAALCTACSCLTPTASCRSRPCSWWLTWCAGASAWRRRPRCMRCWGSSSRTSHRRQSLRVRTSLACSSAAAAVAGRLLPSATAVAAAAAAGLARLLLVVVLVCCCSRGSSSAPTTAASLLLPASRQVAQATWLLTWRPPARASPPPTPAAAKKSRKQKKKKKGKGKDDVDRGMQEAAVRTPGARQRLIVLAGRQEEKFHCHLDVPAFSPLPH